MTHAAKIRVAVYLGAIVFPLAALWILLAMGSSAIDSANFYLCVVIFLFFIVIARWDIVGYGLQFILVLVLLVIAYERGGWRPPASALAILLCMRFPLSRSGAEKPIELSFPLAGGTYYVAHGGNLRLVNHHRVSRSQAYALDVVRLNRLGLRAAGVYPRRFEKYRIFGDVLYSPCEGVVTAAVDDLPDLLPGEMDKKHIAGNHIVIQLNGSEIYIGLAHLMQASLTVKPGEHVSPGQPLGRVGNSGNTSEPHLHIHAKRGGNPKSMGDGAGVPMRFHRRWLIRNSIIRSAVRQPSRTEAPVKAEGHSV